MRDKETHVANFLYRIAGAATLDSRTYEDVEADQTATSQALAVCSLGWLLALGFILVFGLLAGPALSAQTTPAGPQLPSAARVYDGAQLFRNHCATCHGATGRGDGPMSEVLRKPPADLTKFAIEERRHVSRRTPPPNHRWPRRALAWGSRHAGLGDRLEDIARRRRIRFGRGTHRRAGALHPVAARTRGAIGEHPWQTARARSSTGIASCRRLTPRSWASTRSRRRAIVFPARSVTATSCGTTVTTADGRDALASRTGGLPIGPPLRLPGPAIVAAEQALLPGFVGPTFRSGAERQWRTNAPLMRCAHSGAINVTIGMSIQTRPRSTL